MDWVGVVSPRVEVTVVGQNKVDGVPFSVSGQVLDMVSSTVKFLHPTM